MGKTYRRDSERKFRNFQKGKSKPKKLKSDQDEPKFQKHLKLHTDDVDNEY
jgi:hypothetical protein